MKTRSHKASMNSVVKTFKHCRIMPIPVLGVSLPLCEPSSDQAPATTDHILKLIPAGNVLHPRKEFHKVSTWISSQSEAPNKFIGKFDGGILLGFNRRLIINDR